MIKTFTNDDLLRYLYNELPNKEKEEVLQAQLTNTDFEEQSEQLEDTKVLLDGLMLKAPDDVVSKIMAYSRSV